MTICSHRPAAYCVFKPPFFCNFRISLFFSSSSSRFSSFSLMLALSAFFFARRFSSAESSGGASSACSLAYAWPSSESTVLRVLTSLRVTCRQRCSLSSITEGYNLRPA